MRPEWKGGSFFQTISAAITDFLNNGYDSVDRLRFWTAQISDAAKRYAPKDNELINGLRKQFTREADAQLKPSSLKKKHPKVGRISKDVLKPEMQKLLTKRLDASAQLIKLNRARAIADTTQRFSGWASSIPEGGVPAEGRAETKATVSKSLASLNYEQRRVATDQGHKFSAAVNDLIAQQNGAIAVIWHHIHQAGYNGRKAHIARDGKVYALRSGWAYEQGLINKCEGFYDDMDQVGTEVNCRCYAEYIYNIRDIPPEYMTDKGRDYLETVRFRRMMAR